MFLLKKIALCSLLVVVTSTLVMAQNGDRERTEPNLDEVIAYLNLDDGNIACLEANRTAYREAEEPGREQLRELQKEKRELAADGGDTSGVQAQIDALKASMQASRTAYVSSAQACLDAAQAVALGKIIEAETLMNEVRQAKGLMLLQATEEGGAPLRSGKGRRGGKGRKK